MNFLLRKVIKLYLLLPIGFFINIFKKDKKNATILMYHRVNDNIKKELAVTTRNFEWQMNYLKRKNYDVITIDTLIDKIRTNSVTNKCVVLTFDDGYEDYYNNSFKILEKYNFPSIHYLVPGYIEEDKIYWWDKDIGESKVMNWKQILELNKSYLVKFGAHTVNHPDLDKANKEEIHQELVISKEILETKLNEKINHFSYPRGRYNDISKKLVKQTFDSGVLMFNGKEVNNELNDKDLNILKREPVQLSDGKLLFIARLNGWLSIEESIKKLVYKVRNKRVGQTKRVQ
jgi:peptidoglycan/xylan/chitin deacetylase (PgdA/CDA1 family)